MKGQLGNLMKQAQRMQAEAQRMQEEIAAMEIEGQSGGGMVKVLMTGRYDVKRVSIDDNLLGEDRDMLEDLVAAAMNDASQKVRVASEERMSGIATDMGFPSGIKLPF